MFLNLLHIVNINSYKKEQLKFHRSFLDIKGGAKNCRLNSVFSSGLAGIPVKITIFRPNIS